MDKGQLPDLKGQKPQAVPVFILCGGLGTRLRAVERRPKALVPVAGRPFLAYSLRLLRLQGFREIHLLLGHGAAEVAAAFAGPGISCLREDHPLGTGGALGAARSAAGRENLILNGDSYTEALYTDLLQAHRERGGEASEGVTLLAAPIEDCADYGRLEVDPGGAVCSFVEKGAGGPGWINAGVYAAGGGFFRDLPPGPFSLEREVLPALAGRGLLWAYRRRAFFRDIGTPERLRKAQQEFRWVRNRIEDEEDPLPPSEEIDRLLALKKHHGGAGGGEAREGKSLGSDRSRAGAPVRPPSRRRRG